MRRYSLYSVNGECICSGDIKAVYCFARLLSKYELDNFFVLSTNINNPKITAREFAYIVEMIFNQDDLQ